MSKTPKKIDVVRGTANVFADFGYAHAGLERLNSHLAVEIMKVMDARDLTVRQAHAITGIAAADFSRIRNAQLGRFTLDRLVTILEGLGRVVSLKVSARPKNRGQGVAVTP